MSSGGIVCLALVFFLSACEKRELFRVYAQNDAVMIEYCTPEGCDALWPGTLFFVSKLSADTERGDRELVWSFSPGRGTSAPVSYGADEVGGGDVATPLMHGHRYQVGMCVFRYEESGVEMESDSGCAR